MITTCNVPVYVEMEVAAAEATAGKPVHRQFSVTKWRDGSLGFPLPCQAGRMRRTLALAATVRQSASGSSTRVGLWSLESRA